MIGPLAGHPTSLASLGAISAKQFEQRRVWIGGDRRTMVHAQDLERQIEQTPHAVAGRLGIVVEAVNGVVGAVQLAVALSRSLTIWPPGPGHDAKFTPLSDRRQRGAPGPGKSQPHHW